MSQDKIPLLPPINPAGYALYVMFHEHFPEAIAAWPPRSEHPVTRVKLLWGTEITFTVVLTAVVILRYWSSAGRSRQMTGRLYRHM
jgi:hypothetical protein